MEEWESSNAHVDVSGGANPKSSAKRIQPAYPATR